MNRSFLATRYQTTMIILTPEEKARHQRVREAVERANENLRREGRLYEGEVPLDKLLRKLTMSISEKPSDSLEKTDKPRQ